ncbi:methyltransferase [Actinorhabdospora filicis]|uniref:Methyltransferase n=1 Tax=Actinorhabdospora filicis TaxID=1785913 RepID=A0A9W6W649_9ACTN|nr:class I SAM-dependent methyltransferase [Actinorhabdospora filicis]GLZ81142.1 methyltransferase [Actinorhabdospora filicis]
MSSHTEEVRRAYDIVADSYGTLVNEKIGILPVERASMELFSTLIGDGQVVEVGCGTGRASGRLDALGVKVFGVDLSPEMVRVARGYFPHLRFEVGTMTALDIESSSVDGLMAWYSIIHIAPEDLPAVAAEFARVVRPGGHLMLGFQQGEGVPRRIEEAYDHTDLGYTSWRHDPEVVLKAMREAGFVDYVRLREEMREPNKTPQCVLVMDRVA